MSHNNAWPNPARGVGSPPQPRYPGAAEHWAAVCADPIIDPTAWVAPTAIVVGQVRLHPHVSVWYGAVLRGDCDVIEVGAETNIQDGTVIHADPGMPCIIGERITVGHRAILHSATIGDGALIGMGSMVLNRATIGAGALIAAGAVVLEGTEVPPHTLWVGCPAKQVKKLTDEQQAILDGSYQHYVDNAALFRARYASPSPPPYGGGLPS